MSPPAADVPPPAVPSAAQADRRQARTAGGYFESSWDLARGLDVTFRSVGTLPDEFRHEPKPVKSAGSP
ncbi:hypothetical protein [Ideonella sp. A 288]|uniref:hypothetical protein n=1 Tax=Ideonella sp. A 288 TaxID=1962181 RepID=UPI000B4BF8F2|nr:hypothetical protein [Ideonella sp. A 288]